MSVLECFDTVGWVTGRTKPVLPVPCGSLPLNQDAAGSPRRSWKTAVFGGDGEPHIVTVYRGRRVMDGDVQRRYIRDQG